MRIFSTLPCGGKVAMLILLFADGKPASSSSLVLERLFYAIPQNLAGVYPFKGL
jgi:hypothetical protein